MGNMFQEVLCVCTYFSPPQEILATSKKQYVILKYINIYRSCVYYTTPTLS